MAPLPQRSMPTRDAIFAHEEANQDDGFRPHLGGSQIGAECERAIWYGFRWTTRVRHGGRLLRLFDRGQREEERIIAALRAIGVTALDIDPDTGRQWSMRDPTGHAGGSMDGVALGLPEAPKTWAGLEFKTHSIKSFGELAAKGVEKSKPMHWAQMHFYAGLSGLTRFLYVGVNKNDDDIYTEWVHIDPALSIRLIVKAERIIKSERPPVRISNDPAWFVCRFCDHKDTCHRQAMPERHCRSCLHSTPIADGKWRCERHGCQITTAEQKAGCEDHLYIPELVYGVQVDASEDGAWIEYARPDGSVWRDERNKGR